MERNGFKRINPFVRGTMFEYRARDFLRNKGWFVVRQPRSAFPDLIAIRTGDIMLVECKMSGYISRIERSKIIRLARNQTGGKAVLAFQKDGRIVFSELSSAPKRDKTLNFESSEIIETETSLDRNFLGLI